ncbi:MAG: rhodanese-like domain-containing protein [Candidatus Binatia bacterium]
MDEGGYTRSKVLTTPEALEKILDNPSPSLIDTRPTKQLAQGSIPGAVHFDLYGLSLTDTSRAPLEAFTSIMHHLFQAPTLLGYPKVRNDLGSRKEWEDRLYLPIEKPWDKK